MMHREGVCTIWEDNSPDSLVDLAAQTVLKHPQTMFYVTNYTMSLRDAPPGVVRPVVPEFKEKFTHSIKGKGTYDDEPDSSDSEASPKSSRRGSSASEPGFQYVLKLLPGLHLPVEICEKLLSKMYDLGLDMDDRIAVAFGDQETPCRIKRLNLRHSSVTVGGLCSLLANNSIRELDVVGCRRLTPRALEMLNKHGENLVELNLSMTSNDPPTLNWGNNCKFQENMSCILPKAVVAEKKVKKRHRDSETGIVLPRLDDDMEVDEEAEDEWDAEDVELMIYANRGYILNTPNLLRLYLRDMVVSGPNYFGLLFNKLTKLTHLDLSNCRHLEGMNNYEWLPKFFADGSLVYLVLHNSDELGEEAITQNICKLEKLRHLDISQYGRDRSKTDYRNPNKVLKHIVQKLPNLSSLDISGTNLAGNGTFQRYISSDNTSDSDEEFHDASETLDCEFEERMPVKMPEFPKCDIPGLIDRVGRPLDFLGLYKTKNGACSRVHIPAREVSGDLNEAQIVKAGQHYLNRPSVMEGVLNDLFQIFRFENCTDYKSSLDIILLAMDRHPAEKVIQISGSASMYYVVKGEVVEKINSKVKRKILSTILNAMYAYKDDLIMMRNGCLTLCHFEIPNDIIEHYERLVRILLYAVSCNGGEEASFVQLASICLLNTLACQVDGKQKLLVGDMGAMEKMLDLIQNRLETNTCDNVMENAWSTMWNVTDETPINCQRFLKGDGMELFLQCKKAFPDKESLLRNMMGLLGNVAEVPALRPQLMTVPFVTEFSNLLDSHLDGIEVSYNAAGVLAHMASDGEEAWTIDTPSRRTVLSKMVRAIESWDIKSRRNINYRSFEPILRLVRVTHTPQCQHWAIWALANLTEVDVKYCSLIQKEGGLDLLEGLIESSPGDLDNPIIKLAHLVRNNVARWNELKRDG